MKYKLTFALVAAMTSTAFAAFQAPLPEFKNEKQLAEWRAEKASEATRQGYAAEESAFYTGKPYLESSDSYTFKYRSYDPELARWRTEDPSGFPDGANGNLYTNNSPIGSLDYMGLATLAVTVSMPWTTTLGFAQTAQWNGSFLWDVTPGMERQSISSTPGLTGDLPANITWNQGAVRFGIGQTFVADSVALPDWEYRVSFGVNQRRYKVDLQVNVYISNSFGATSIGSTPAYQSPHLVTHGQWLE